MHEDTYGMSYMKDMTCVFLCRSSQLGVTWEELAAQIGQ